MAENKKSFIAYSDWNGMFKALPDDLAGKLIKHIFSYVNDENPTTDDFMVNALFEQIKTSLKRDLVKWEGQREQRSSAGKKSAEIRSTKSNERSISFNEKVRNTTDSVSVSVSVNESVSENVSVSENKKQKVKAETKVSGRALRFTPPTLEMVSKYCDERQNTVNPTKWVNHYTANGWKVGRTKMVDWKAAVRTWEGDDYVKPNTLQTKKTEHPLQGRFLAIWEHFYEKQNNVPPLVQSLQKWAANELAGHFLDTFGKGDEEIALTTFENMFNLWGRLDSFTAKKTDITDINKNINSIINQIKNHGTNLQERRTEQALREKLEQAQRANGYTS